MYIRVAIFCTSLITENCTLSISGYNLLMKFDSEIDKQYFFTEILPQFIINKADLAAECIEKAAAITDKDPLPFIRKFFELFEGYEKYKGDINSANKDLAERFRDKLKQKEGSIYENNCISELISELIGKLRDDKGREVILIIDDLDRIDPAHIFRLFNVFAAHFDYRSEDNNKFGFDRIIFVCDIQNIRNIFQHVYGANVDFNGYIDKFYSKKIFKFDTREFLASFIINILRSLTYSTFIDTDRYIKKRIVESKPLILTIKELIYQGKLNLRTLFKYYDKTIPLHRDSITFEKGMEYKTVLFQGIIEMNILYELFGSFDSLIDALDFCRKNIEHSSELCELDPHLSNILFLLDFKKNRFKYNFQTDPSYRYIDEEHHITIDYKLKEDPDCRLQAYAIEGLRSIRAVEDITPYYSNIIFFQLQLIKMLKRISYYS